MRKFFYFFPLLPLLFNNFFCSDYFNPSTSIGLNIINDADPILTRFDGNIFKDTLEVISASSFTDSTDSIISGLNQHGYMVFGTWKNELIYSFFKFHADSLIKRINANNNGEIKILSIVLDIMVDFYNSTIADNTIIEISLCDNKSNIELFTDTAQFESLIRYSLNDTTSNIELPIKLKFINPESDSVNVTDTNTVLTVISKIDTITETKSDTTYTSGKYDTNIVLLDSIISLLSKVQEPDKNHFYKGPRIDTSISTSQDTIIYYYDTLIAVPDTAIDHNIHTKLIHKISYDFTDTTDIIEFDTVQTIKAITYNTFIQSSKISKKLTITSHISKPSQSDLIKIENDSQIITKNLCFCARVKPSADTSLIFFNYEPSINISYISQNDTAENDTLLDTFLISYYDNTVLEKDKHLLPLDKVLCSSGAAGRYTKFEIDLQPLRDSLIDSSGKALFRNVLWAALTVYPESCEIYTPYHTDSITSVRSAIYTDPNMDIEGLNSSYYYSISRNFLSSSTDSIVLQLENCFIDILSEESTFPKKAYLYLWIPSSFFSHIYWKKPDNGFKISSVFTNSE